MLDHSEQRVRRVARAAAVGAIDGRRPPRHRNGNQAANGGAVDLDSLSLVNILREHLQTIGVFVAFLQMPRALTEGMESLFDLSSSMLHAGTGSYTFDCALWDVGKADRQEAGPEGIPASSSEVYVLAWVWVILSVAIVAWAALVQLVMPHVTLGNIRQWCGNCVADAVEAGIDSMNSLWANESEDQPSSRRARAIVSSTSGANPIRA